MPFSLLLLLPTTFTLFTLFLAAIHTTLLKRGLPYMMSAVGEGRGVPKKQTKGTKSADL